MLFVPDWRSAQCGFVGRECLTSTCIHLCTCMCVMFLTGDLQSAVWPAGFAAFVPVLWLFPDRRLALCGLAGRGDCLCVCCGSSLTGDLPCAVWPAGVTACVCVVALP